MYLLDTNICIYAMKNKYPTVLQKLLLVPPQEIYLSSITVGELEYGASKSRWSEKNRHAFTAFLSAFSVLPFTYHDAIRFGRLRAQLALKGTPIGYYDVMIAAQGIERNLTVVTHNTKEFQRVEGITLEDWVLA